LFQKYTHDTARSVIDQPFGMRQGGMRVGRASPRVVTVDGCLGDVEVVIHRVDHRGRRAEWPG
jgi:hypothetical protein